MSESLIKAPKYQRTSGNFTCSVFNGFKTNFFVLGKISQFILKTIWDIYVMQTDCMELKVFSGAINPGRKMVDDYNEPLCYFMYFL